jgi:hypothetical protein
MRANADQFFSLRPLRVRRLADAFRDLCGRVANDTRPPSEAIVWTQSPDNVAARVSLRVTGLRRPTDELLAAALRSYLLEGVVLAVESLRE